MYPYFPKIILFFVIFFAFFVSPAQDNQIRRNAEKLQAEAEEAFKKQTTEQLLVAKNKFTESLGLWEKLNDDRHQAETLKRLSEIAFISDKGNDGIDLAKKSLVFFEKLDDKPKIAETLNNIGGLLDHIGSSRESFPYLLKSLAIFEELKAIKQQAVTLNTIGLAYSNIGEMQNALTFLNRSLILRRESKDILGEVRTLINIGTIYDDTGEKRKGSEYYAQGLLLAKEAKDFRLQGVALNNLGYVFNHLGEYQKSLDYYQEAIELRRKSGDKRGEATTLTNIGTIYSTMGEHEKALDLTLQSLKIYQDAGLRRNEARSFNSLGSLHSKMEKPEAAIQYFEKALAIYQEIGDKEGQASSLRNIGSIFSDRNQLAESFKFLQEGLKLAEEASDHETICDILLVLAQTYSKANDNTNAEKHFARALQMQREGELKEDLMQTLFHYAVFDEKNENREQAIAKMQEVIEILEDIRNSITLQSFRSTFLSTTQNFYDFYIELLIKSHFNEPNKGFDELAFKISEKARARSLLDSLGESQTDIRANISPELLEEEEILRQMINAKDSQRIMAINQKQKEKAKEFEKELDETLQKYRLVQTRIRQQSPQFASLTQPEQLEIKQIQSEMLDEDSVLLEYVLGKEKSFVFVISKNSFEIVELSESKIIEDLTRKAVENLKARGYEIENENLSTRTARIKKADELANANLKELGEILIKPIASKIEDKRLLIVPSDVLQYLPFAALPANSGSKNNFLIETNEIVYLPSASVLPFLQQNKSRSKNIKTSVGILADPVFTADDVRLKQLKNPSINNTVMVEGQVVSSLKLRSDFSRLRFTRSEAEAISSFIEDEEKFVALDFAANLKTIHNENLQQSRIVHLATHGIINSQFPELSGLVLSLVDENGKSQDGILRLYEIYNLQLEADLVVLSACETALGKEIKGEGIIGLTRGFMYVGVPSVVASLWRVEDRATADLMKRFYQRMLVEKLPPSKALRESQISMIGEKTSAHPFFWAGFTLQGDWR